MKDIIVSKNKEKKVINHETLYLNFDIPCLSNKIFNLFSFSSIILKLKLYAIKENCKVIRKLMKEI